MLPGGIVLVLGSLEAMPESNPRMMRGRLAIARLVMLGGLARLVAHRDSKAFYAARNNMPALNQPAFNSRPALGSRTDHSPGWITARRLANENKGYSFRARTLYLLH